MPSKSKKPVKPVVKAKPIAKKTIKAKPAPKAKPVVKKTAAKPAAKIVKKPLPAKAKPIVKAKTPAVKASPAKLKTPKTVAKAVKAPVVKAKAKPATVTPKRPDKIISSKKFMTDTPKKIDKTPVKKAVKPTKKVEAKTAVITKTTIAPPAKVVPLPEPKPKQLRSSAPRDISKLGTEKGMAMWGMTPYQEKPGEEYMNTKQKAHFRELLLRWKRELMEEVDRTVHHMQDEAANYPDLNDRASQEEEFNLELRARDRERNLIRKIEEALDRIEMDEFGYCEACGVDIGVRRLEARPVATLCIDCKTLEEIKEKQTKG